MDKSLSPGIRADLGKLDPSHRSEVRRVAGSHTTSTNSKGANRKLPAVDMSRKVLAPAVVPPAPQIADWPKTILTAKRKRKLAHWRRTLGPMVKQARAIGLLQSTAVQRRKIARTAARARWRRQRLKRTSDNVC